MEKTVPKYKIVARMLLAVFWVLGTYLFPIQELVPGAADAARATGSIVSDALIILAGLWTLRARIDIALYVVLLLIGGVSAWYNDIPAVMAINGLRAYLLPLSLLIIVRYLLSTRERVRYFLPRFEKSLYIFLLLQFPVMVIQCLRWGAYDNVGGSLGWMMSGTISTLIYLISFYLMVRRWDDSRTYLENLKQNYMLLVCLFPSMLNETKISFVYLAMYIFFLVPMDRMFLKRILYVIPLMLLSIGGAVALYITILGGATIDDYEGTQTDVTSSKFISEYMVGNDEVRTLVLDGYMETVMPDVQEADFARGLKYAVLPIILGDTPHAWYVGFGPSQFKGGTTLETTPFAKEYEWLLRGTEMSVMSYLIDLGVAGLLWLAWYIIVLFRFFHRVRKRSKRITWNMVLTLLISLAYFPLHTLFIPMIVFTFVAMMSSRVPLFRYAPRPSGWLLKPMPETVGPHAPTHAKCGSETPVSHAAATRK